MTAIAQFPRVRLLPIERAFRFDSTPCDECAGSGQYALGARCYTCWGFGRRFTLDARAIIRDVCTMLAITDCIDSHGRWQSDRITVAGRDLAVGMHVLPLGVRFGDAVQFDVIARIEDLNPYSRRVHFARGGTVVATLITTFERHLTEYDLDRVDVWCAALLGRGVSEA